MDDADISLTPAEYSLVLRGHTWIRSVDPYASVSRGWAGILVELLDVLAILMEDVAADHLDAHAVHFTTKSKLGSLRVHFALAGVSSTGDALWRPLRAAVERAEARSAGTCERCGAPGRLRDIDGWVMTLCDAHGDLHEGL